MPELPEVEIVRRGLDRAMRGTAFEGVELRRSDLRFPFPAGFARRLVGARVVGLRRRGKYLFAPLSSGESLIMHLGMSGRFTVRPRGAPNAPDNPARAGHDHVSFHLIGPSGPVRVDYSDPRRFGFMDLAPTEALERSPHFAALGPEPLSAGFTAPGLRRSLSRRAAPLKAALLDQSVIAGLGNIYVCEALHAARLSPRRKAATIGPRRADALHAAIRSILLEAIDAGGSTLKDFAASDGGLGYFQQRFRVYDREGAPCGACGAPIRRIVQSGRSTFFCGRCQT
jgi:formamidopyrimidine-DNA glycosylase